ncbi:glycosyl hydrolase [Marinobacter sp. SS8-8]|uniref:WD40/YVTN/BNR-like repeat-containing protein n=1 Tax=Marinobacter sp. SS8-8 TaxID=3050452 RepID=UPI0026DF86C0|nr:glycosyl hydrolase [Marinobacter sp. SS8-8]|tara:strand:- start:56962 stop:57954 length:993 start_codon:yes stop_codon:yes gene_type:complete
MQNPPLRSWRTVGIAIAIVSSSSFLLTGCEAPLNLEAVRQVSEQSSKRTDFYQAMARNDELIVVSGNSGVLLTSSDNGATWRRQSLNSTASFLALDVCPDSSFLALTFDNQIWHGNAQASRWTSHALPSQEQMMTATCAPDGSWWTAGSFTTIQYSSDQGQSWDETSLFEDAIINNLQFLTQDQAIATGEYGMVLRSDDGGLNWDYAGYLPDEFYAHTSYFRSTNEGWVGGLNGFIYHTTDGGQNWVQMPADTNAPVFGFIPGNSALYAVADNATVLALQGSAWEKISESDQPLYLRTGLLLPDQKLLVAGGRGLLFKLEIPMALAASID